MTFGKSFYLALLAAFALIGLLAAWDLGSDLGEGTALGHVLIEAIVIILALAGIAVLIRYLLKQTTTARQESMHLATRLAQSYAAAAQWQAQAQSLLQGLGQAIDRQFDAWHLTPAEKQVALLLLKGLSHKEIAHARGVGEATTRQQAQAIYRKAGLSGRHDLAAFFLEDLTLPRGDC